MSAADLLDFSPEVAEARSAKRPIVALESTIITHGMPYPRNVETALAVEDAVREMGAVPATIAVIEGRFRVGLSSEEIDRLGQLSGGVVKASRRDLALVAARKGSAGTTVAATMFIAGLAGIEIFATGGIGGVHRGRRGDVRHLGRSGRAFAHPRRGRLRRRQIDPRYREDARVPGNPGSRGRRLPHRRVPRLLRPLVRLQARTSLRRAPRSRPHDPPAARHRPRRAPHRQSDSLMITRLKRRRSRRASPKLSPRQRRKAWARRRRRRFS